MKIKILLITFLLLVACKKERVPIHSFTELALSDQLETVSGKRSDLNSILTDYKGKTIVIDFWASWCKDCIKGMPDLKLLQTAMQSKDVVFVFLSLDKTKADWKRAITRYQITGEHFFIKSGWDGNLCTSVDLDWIPRYMVVNKSGEIVLDRAIKANDIEILNAIQNDNKLP